MSAARLLRQVRRAAGLSQRAMAELAGVHQPGLAAVESGAHDATVASLERLLGSAGYRLIAVPTSGSTAAEVADAVQKALSGGDEDAAFRWLLQLNDDLMRVRGPVQLALALAPPPRVGDRRYDAFIAALIEHRLTAMALPVPGWVHDQDRTARPVWFVDELPSYRVDAYRTSPISFVRRGVFVNASDLRSV